MGDDSRRVLGTSWSQDGGPVWTPGPCELASESCVEDKIKLYVSEVIPHYLEQGRV